MLFSQATLLMALATSMVSARPHYKRWDGDYTPDSSPHSKHSKSWLNVLSPISSSTCDLSAATLPSSSLPAPPASLSLFQVAIGRGTQNYTCDLSNSTAVPAPIGAVANLYNVSCMASRSPDLLNALPAIALQLPTAPANGGVLPFSADLSGHHYFTDNTTPYFNLNTAEHQYGAGAFKKSAATPAPAGAQKGQMGQGYGAVPWLQLVAKDPSQKLQQVYRVNTQGGQPPASCKGQQAAFQVQYSAEYWFYA